MPLDLRSVATLVQLACAGHTSGDRELARQARRELLGVHGVRLSFVRRPPHEISTRADSPSQAEAAR